MSGNSAQCVPTSETGRAMNSSRQRWSIGEEKTRGSLSTYPMMGTAIGLTPVIQGGRIVVLSGVLNPLPPLLQHRLHHRHHGLSALTEAAASRDRPDVQDMHGMPSQEDQMRLRSAVMPVLRGSRLRMRIRGGYSAHPPALADHRGQARGECGEPLGATPACGSPNRCHLCPSER